MSTTTSPIDPDALVQPDDSPTTIRDTVLRALHDAVPGIALEDVLELRVLIDPPVQNGSRSSQARVVLAAVQEEVKTWPDPPTIYVPPIAHE